MIDGEISIDYFIKFEEMEKGIRDVCNLVGIPFENERNFKLKRDIRKSGHNLREYYDDETIDIVNKIYQIEIELFGYSFELN